MALYHYGVKGMKWGVTRSQKVASAAGKTAKELRNLSSKFDPKPTRKKLDLSKMTDQEMRDQINRHHLEKQYNDIFGTIPAKQKSAGKKFIDGFLDISAPLLTSTASALGIAVALKEIKKKK